MKDGRSEYTVLSIMKRIRRWRKKGSLENGKSSNVVNCSKEVHSEKS